MLKRRRGIFVQMNNKRKPHELCGGDYDDDSGIFEKKKGIQILRAKNLQKTNDNQSKVSLSIAK